MSVRRGTISLLLMSALIFPVAARAQDAFEIQVYDSETAGPGEIGIEIHSNYFGGDHGIGHLTFEPHIGFGDWGELGGYFQTAIRSGWEYAGVKLRFKVRYPEKLANLVGLAINFEVSDVPAELEPNRYATEIRPIVDLRARAFYFAFNPILDVDLAGSIAGQPQFAPALKAALFFVDRPGLRGAGGLEYYGLFSTAGQANNLFAVLDFTSDYVDLNLGVGHSTGPGAGWIAKSILGFHPRRDAPPPKS